VILFRQLRTPPVPIMYEYPFKLKTLLVPWIGAFVNASEVYEAGLHEHARKFRGVEKKISITFFLLFLRFFFNKLNTRPEMPTNFFLSPFRYEKFEQKEGRLRSCRTRDVTPRLRNPAQDSSN